MYIFKNEYGWGENWIYANALKPFDFDVDSDSESVMGSDKIINKNLKGVFAKNERLNAIKKRF